MKSARPLSRILFPLTAASLLAAGGTAHGDLGFSASANPSLRVVTPSSHRELHSLFHSEGYDWKTLHKGVPPLVMSTLPADLARVPRITERKRLFFLSLLPMVLIANEEISRKREELLWLFERFDAGEALDAVEAEFVASIAREYGLKGDPLADFGARDALLKRVDIVPPSLVLAQAANESAYGTSRFALKGNNLFGEWTLIPGNGLVPRQRPAGEIYEVRRFPTLLDSVKAYLKNINTHTAYLPLRDRRAALRAEGLPLQGRDLARGLTKYSVRGEAYVDEIREIIRRNRLSLLSSATLRQDLSAAGQGRHGLLSTGHRASRRSQIAGYRRAEPLPVFKNQPSLTLLRR